MRSRRACAPTMTLQACQRTARGMPFQLRLTNCALVVSLTTQLRFIMTSHLPWRSTSLAVGALWAVRSPTHTRFCAAVTVKVYLCRRPGPDAVPDAYLPRSCSTVASCWNPYVSTWESSSTVRAITVPAFVPGDCSRPAASDALSVGVLSAAAAVPAAASDGFSVGTVSLAPAAGAGVAAMGTAVAGAAEVGAAVAGAAEVGTAEVGAVEVGAAECTAEGATADRGPGCAAPLGFRPMGHSRPHESARVYR